MTLEEAKERFRELVNTNKGFLSNIAEDKTEWNSTYYKSMCEDVKAMEINLDYIENESIPKEKVKELYEEYKKIIRHYDHDGLKRDETYYETIKICDVLLRLLGE